MHFKETASILSLKYELNDQKGENVKVLLAYPLDPLNSPPRGPPIFENMICPLLTPSIPYFTP